MSLLVLVDAHEQRSNPRMGNLTANEELLTPTFHRVSCHLLQGQRITICNPHWASLKAHSAGNITHSSLCDLCPTLIAR
jgi:hypothetical protein